MRIIGGRHGGRVLQPSMKKWPTRPTTDIAKEALFNILNNKIELEGISVLDLFGGTGGISVEFASRGAEKVTYVDSYHACITWMKEISALLDLNQIEIIRSDVKRYLKGARQSYDLVFCDPPYSLPWLRELPDLIYDSEVMCHESSLIIEHGSDVSFSGHRYFSEQRKYGQSIFSFFVAHLEED